jgi:hypothetical protein
MERPWLIRVIDIFYQLNEIFDLHQRGAVRTLLTHKNRRCAMAKVLCVLYDDPISGYPKSYARDGLPKIEKYPDGQTLPTPKGIDFTPGTLLGSVSANWDCANTWSQMDISMLSPRAKRVPTAFSTKNFPTPR